MCSSLFESISSVFLEGESRSDPAMKDRIARVENWSVEHVANRITLKATSMKALLNLLLFDLDTTLTSSIRSPRMNRIGNESSNMMNPMSSTGTVKAETIATGKRETTDRIMKSNEIFASYYFSEISESR